MTEEWVNRAWESKDDITVFGTDEHLVRLPNCYW